MALYDLFISHSWTYNDAYEGLTKILDSAPPYFSYKNYLVPKDDPVHNAPNEALLYEAIKRHIVPSQVIVILAGVYATFSKWIDKEIQIAKKEFPEPKPILAIEPWGAEMTSQKVKDNADKIVAWDTGSVVSAIRELARSIQERSVLPMKEKILQKMEDAKRKLEMELGNRVPIRETSRISRVTDWTYDRMWDDKWMIPFTEFCKETANMFGFNSYGIVDTIWSVIFKEITLGEFPLAIEAKFDASTKEALQAAIRISRHILKEFSEHEPIGNVDAYVEEWKEKLSNL